MRSPLRQPALHFLAIGSLLFAAQTLLGAGLEVAAPAPPGSLPPERTAALVEAWRARTGAAPGPTQLAALVRAEQTDELWVAEARRRGLHRRDPLVRRRLARNLRFVSGADAGGDDALVAEALRLGMDRSDPVVRRRLVQVMKLGVAAAARAEEPDEAELRAHLERHRERYRQPARVRLSHVYLSRDRRGRRAEADAAALRAELVAASRGPEAAAEAGDPFLIPPHLPLRSRAELARDFGEGFAAAVAGLAAGGWSAPLASAYGLHLVWVHERSEPSDPPLDRVRAAVRASLLAERAERAVARTAAELRGRR